MKTVFHTNDLIVPTLKFPDPCPISIQIKNKDIILHVGQRDWQWDLADGHLVGCGTCVDPLILTESQKRRLKTKQAKIRGWMARDKKKRKKGGERGSGN